MKIIVKNLSVEYRDEGRGPVILFLHGWMDSLHTFDRLISEFGTAWRVVRVDLPGFGQSEMPKKAWDLYNYTQFVKDFIDKLNIQADVLIGHSFGGKIIIKGIAENVISAKKIVLIASAGIAKTNAFKISFKILAKIGKVLSLIPPLVFWRGKLRQKLYEQTESDYLKTGALKETFLKIIAEDLETAAGLIKTPALLIWGRCDQETPLADGEHLSKLIHGSKLKIIADAGHFVHQEKPKEAAQLIKNFL